MTRHSLLLALATSAGLAMPGAALADDNDDNNRILRGLAASQFEMQGRDRNDDRWWGGAYRVGHDDDHDDDDRRGRWGDDDWIKRGGRIRHAPAARPGRFLCQAACLPLP